MELISIDEIANQTGMSTNNIQVLVRRGILPAGSVLGGKMHLPLECLQKIREHKPGTHWIKNRPRFGKRKVQPMSWEDVI